MDEINENEVAGTTNGHVVNNPYLIQGLAGNAISLYPEQGQYVTYGSITHGTCARELTWDTCTSGYLSISFWFRIHPEEPTSSNIGELLGRLH